MTGQVTAPLLQASSLCPLSCARANRRLSLMLLPAYERLFSSSGLSVQPSSVDSTQIELGILDIRLPPSPAMLSTPCPGSLGQVAGICLFSSLQLPHCTFSSTRMTFFPSGDHMITSGLRDLDSTASGKWSFLRGQPPPPIIMQVVKEKATGGIKAHHK